MHAILNDLRAFTARNVFNPWREWDEHDKHASAYAAGARMGRLMRHFDCTPRFLLIGEAPGYQGCRYSGVPFTSERLILAGVVPRGAEDQDEPNGGGTGAKPCHRRLPAVMRENTMKVAEAVDLIEAWAKRHDDRFRMRALLRAACVGARPKDIPEIGRWLVASSHRSLMSASAAFAVKDGHCECAERCAKVHGCIGHFVEAQVAAGCAIVLACAQRSGPEFPSPPWPESDDIIEWMRALAAANGIEVDEHSPPDIQVVRVAVPPGATAEQVSEAVQDALREAQVESAAAAKKRAVN